MTSEQRLMVETLASLGFPVDEGIIPEVVCRLIDGVAVMINPDGSIQFLRATSRGYIPMEKEDE